MGIPEILFFVLLAIYFVVLPKLFARAGQDSWKGYVPFYQYIIWLKILGRPWWWIILLITPGVNFLVLVILNVETAIAFNQREIKNQWLAGLLPWLYLPQLAFKNTEKKFIGPRDWTGKKKSWRREWGEAIVFAIIAASVIRTFFFEAFTIPTGSMENSMLVNDYLFVSKMSYGAKIPMTPMSVPFVHNRIPGSMNRSFVEWFELPYMRLPGFGSVDRGDAVVFNFPHGDTVMLNDPLAGHDYYQLLKKDAIIEAGGYENFLANKSAAFAKARSNMWDKNIVKSDDPKFKNQQNFDNPNPKDYRGTKIEGMDVYPVDKNENYVKRCVGLPGDNFQIIDRVIHINGIPQEMPEGAKHSYLVRTKGNDYSKIAKRLDLTVQDGRPVQQAADGSVYNIINLSEEQLTDIARLPFLLEPPQAQIRGNSPADKELPDSLRTPDAHNYGLMFPYSDRKKYVYWTIDNFGPIHIPKAGETIELTADNIDEYRRTITKYDGNHLEVEADGTIKINGQATTSYTFKHDCFFMMGDNRHGSADSRFFGWVPETHIVGKPVLTWFSKGQEGYHQDTGIRWERMFRLVD